MRPNHQNAEFGGRGGQQSGARTHLGTSVSSIVLLPYPCPSATASVRSAVQRPCIALDFGGAGRPRDVAAAPEKRLKLRPARHSLPAQSHSAQNATIVAHAERFSAEPYDEESRMSAPCANAGWRYSGVDRQQGNTEQTTSSGGTGHGHHGRLWVCRWSVVLSHLAKVFRLSTSRGCFHKCS